MSIETDLKRLADAAEGILAHLTGGAPAKVTTGGDPLEVPGAAKRGRPAKAAGAAATDGADAGASAAATDGAAKTATEKITEPVLREHLRQYILRHETKGKNEGMKAATALLTQFGAKTVSTIKPEDYAAIVKHCIEDKAKYDAASAKK